MKDQFNKDQSQNIICKIRKNQIMKEYAKSGSVSRACKLMS